MRCPIILCSLKLNDDKFIIIWYKNALNQLSQHSDKEMILMIRTCILRFSICMPSHGVFPILATDTYGSVSAGREKWPFNVIFFLKVEPPCDQT